MSENRPSISEAVSSKPSHSATEVNQSSDNSKATTLEGPDDSESQSYIITMKRLNSGYYSKQGGGGGYENTIMTSMVLRIM